MLRMPHPQVNIYPALSNNVSSQLQKEFEQELQDAGDRLVAVDFTADWCTKNNEVRRKLTDVMYQTEFAEVVFLQVDVDDNQVFEA